MKYVKPLHAFPVAAIIAAFLAVNAFPGFAEDAVWKGSDGDALDDAANWSGGNPFYDAETNPDTPLCFNAAAKARIDDGLTAYQLKFGAKNISLGVDLKGKTLALIGEPVAWHSNGGNAVAFTNGTVTSATRFTFGTGTGLDFQAVTLTANLYCAALNAWAKVGGGSKVTGYWGDYDQAKNVKLTVSGKGTVWDFNGNGFCIGGRGNANSFSNSVCITDYAVVTNIGTTCPVTGYSGLTILGNGHLFELSNGARLYQETGLFQIGINSGNTPQYGPDKFRVLSGAKAFVRGIVVGRHGKGNLVEVAGKGSLLRVANAASADCAWGYQTGSSNNVLWVHDHGTVTNLSSDTHIAGYFNDTQEPKLIVEDGSEFTCGNLSLGAYRAYRALIRVDDGSILKCNRFFIGTEGYARTNTVWVGNDSQIVCSDYGYLNKGAASTLAISNGTFEVVNGKDFQIYATNTVMLAGTKPMLDGYALGLSYPGVKIVFDMPAEGFTTESPLIRNRTTGQALTLGTDITPVFANFEKFLNSDAEKKTITLVESAYAISMSDEALAKWRAALPEKGCTLALSSDKKKLLLTCKPARGLMIILR